MLRRGSANLEQERSRPVASNNSIQTSPTSLQDAASALAATSPAFSSFRAIWETSRRQAASGFVAAARTLAGSFLRIISPHLTPPDLHAQLAADREPLATCRIVAPLQVIVAQSHSLGALPLSTITRCPGRCSDPCALTGTHPPALSASDPSALRGTTHATEVRRP